MCVLRYIQNTRSKYKIFVANRLEIIHDATPVERWFYVPTHKNPADAASRGLMPDDTKRIAAFLQGPDFLKEEKYPNYEKPATKPSEEELDEVKVPDLLVATTQDESGYEIIPKICQRYSTLYRCTRAAAVLCKFVDFLKYKRATLITVEDIQKARMRIISDHQKRYFKDEKESIKVGELKASSRIRKLVPIMDEDGLLRVSGRLQNSWLPEKTKHPIILDPRDHIVNLIIDDVHIGNGHVGSMHTLNKLREDYWIISGLAAVKKRIGKCMYCKRTRKPLMKQQMAPLPSQRLTPEEPPFTFTGLDYFGPVSTKLARKEFKRYGCLFTCLTSRAIHLEMSYDLTTESFLCALNRFIARRGRPKEIFSDNGTNFVGGERELREQLKAMNQRNLDCWAMRRDIKWHFIAARSPHWGGVWERLVQSVKKIMFSLLKGQRLTDELFQTTLAIVESILNDRPLTKVSTDAKDEDVLTPSMLLGARSSDSLPPGLFDKRELYSRKYWRQANYLADMFWRRWLKEYLPTLQSRSKWTTVEENLKTNEIVLVADDLLPRGQWPLGIIVEPLPGSDGLVRSAKVKFQGTVKTRPIVKLCRLEENVC